MLTCRDIAEQVTEHLEGQGSRLERLRFRLHLLLCRHCRTYVDQIEQTIRALRELPPEPPDSGARSGLLARFREWRP